MHTRTVATALVAVLTALFPIASPASAARGNASPCGKETLTKADGTAWDCTFADDFSGRSLDTRKWTVTQTAATGNHYNVDCLVDSRRNVRVAKGTLRLSVRRLAEPMSCSSPFGAFTTEWTGGMVTTGRKFAQAYGRYEIRAAFPDATVPGMHGALWLYPQATTYGKWPASGEIDVAEHRTAMADRAVPTLHYLTGGADARTTNWNCRIGDASAFHTYLLEWSPSAITISYDGEQCLTTTSWAADGLPLGAPFNKPFFLLLTQGRGVGGNSPTAQTPTSGTMQVDYVRVWQ